MERDGFPSPLTVASFLQKKELKAGTVVIVDEAGQIGGKPMLELLRLVVERNARLILSGDTRQHGAVEAGDALRAIEKHSGVQPVELTNIRRQNPALAKSIEERKHIKEYRQAVEEARDGKFTESFERLDKLKTIESCTLADKHEKLTARYLELVKDHQSTVVVSQSWNEIHQVNDAIRAALKNEKLVGEAETTVTAFQPVDLTEAQKRDARSYDANTVLVFNRDVRGFKAGESARAESDYGHAFAGGNGYAHRSHFIQAVGQADGLPAQGTGFGRWRQAATQGQWPQRGKPQAGQWRTGHGQGRRAGRPHCAGGWPGLG